VVPEKGEAAKLIHRTNSGVVVPGRNIEMIVQKLKSLIQSEQNFTWNGIEEFSRERQAQILNNFLDAHI
jgi:hypothetical protein